MSHKGRLEPVCVAKVAVSLASKSRARARARHSAPLAGEDVFFFFWSLFPSFPLYEKMHGEKAISALCRYKGRLSRRADQRNEATVYRRRKNFELHRKRPARSPPVPWAEDSEARYQTAMSPNERKVSQRGRTDPMLVDRGAEEGRGRVEEGWRANTLSLQRGGERARASRAAHTFSDDDGIARLPFPCDLLRPSSPLVPLRRDKTREKPSTRYTYLIARGYIRRTHYANHGEFIAGTFQNQEIKYEIYRWADARARSLAALCRLPEHGRR